MDRQSICWARTRAMVTVTAVVLALSAAGRAHAQTDPAAKTALGEGRELMDQDQYEQACAKFEQSLEIERSARALLQLALCYEKLGKTASAWQAYTEAADLADGAGKRRRAARARRHAERLEPTLPRLIVRYDGTPPDDLAVYRDDVAITDRLGADVFVDPGEHVLTANADGYQSWLQTVTAAPGETLEVAIQMAEVPPPPPPPPPKPKPTPTSTSESGAIGIDEAVRIRTQPAPPDERGLSWIARGGAGLYTVEAIDRGRIGNRTREDNGLVPLVGVAARTGAGRLYGVAGATFGYTPSLGRGSVMFLEANGGARLRVADASPWFVGASGFLGWGRVDDTDGLLYAGGVSTGAVLGAREQLELELGVRYGRYDGHTNAAAYLLGGYAF